jgi:heat shock protein HtpX
MGLALGVGSIWGTRGLLIGFIFGGAMNLVAFFLSDKIALAQMRAVPVDPGQAPELDRMVEELSQQAGIPKPRLYISPAQAPNAFATGRSPRHAAVCVTQGLVGVLSPREVRAVIAHELAHIKHRDTLISTVVAVVAGAITSLAHLAIFLPVSSSDGEGRGGNPLAGLLLVIFAPLAALLIQMAISRSREYAADHRGAELHGNPLDLASALQRLDAYARRVPLPVNPSTSNIFIVQPLTAEGFSSLFGTHPSTERRVQKLYEQAGVAR